MMDLLWLFIGIIIGIVIDSLFTITTLNRYNDLLAKSIDLGIRIK